MLTEIAKEFSNHINKTQDEWFMDILVKHCSPEYKGKTLSGFDIVFIQDQFNLEVYSEEGVTKVTIDGELVGYWDTNYKWDNEGGKVTLHIDKWVK